MPYPETLAGTTLAADLRMSDLRDLNKRIAEDAHALCGGGKATDPVDRYGRESILSRIHRVIRDGEAAEVRLHAARRAQALLAQHPEVGELLDLLQQF